MNLVHLPGWLMSLVFLLSSIILPAQELVLTDIRLDEEHRPGIRFTPDPGHYYLLYRGDVPTQVVQPVDGVLGDRADAVRDAASATLEARFYRVQQVSIQEPLDLDDDGIDDVYELNHRPFLDPLDPSDAARVPDGDGYTTLEEYLAIH